MRTYPIVYTAVVDGATVQGVAQVPVPGNRTRPSWSDCARAVPGFVTGADMAANRRRQG